MSVDSAAALKLRSFTGIVIMACDAHMQGQSVLLDHNHKSPQSFITMSAPQQSHPPVVGQFAFLAKIGATPEAVATLNDQPYVFFVLVAALIILILQSLFIWYIHYGTMKPEQKKKKEKKDDKKPGGKPPAQR
ncbi:hypothetical protein F5Y19DRAFT_470383 [Xylariaceae sp. FL1651]|nr:hypothetical protein F5Y19DRAFT_470383 [Xylariaceae sp. FL1651]